MRAKRFLTIALVCMLLLGSGWGGEYVGAAPSPVIAETSMTPANNAVEVTVDSQLVLQFDEAVTAGENKRIILKQAWDDSTVESLLSSDTDKVTIANGTEVRILPGSQLLYGSDYYVEIEAGAFENGEGHAYQGMAGNSAWRFTTEVRSEVTASDSGELSAYLVNPHVSTIHLMPQQRYEYAGGKISRSVAINGNGSTIEAGSGMLDTVVRSDDVTVQSASLPNYANVQTFLIVEGPGSALSLNNVTLENGQDELFAVINVKTGGRLSMDGVTVKGFHNNTVPGEKLSFGIHAEPGALSTSIANSVFDSSNAFRNAVAIRNGELAISGNTFQGTDYPERLRQSDGYEYAMYIYGGSGSITGNTITGYDSTNQQGFTSAGIAVIGFYATNVTIADNALDYNESGIDVTVTWSPWSSNTSMTVNGIALTNSDDAYVMGEALKAANRQDYVGVSLDQTDEVELTSGEDQSLYYPVLGGYRSPFLTRGEISEETAVIRFRTDSLSKDMLQAAESVELERRTHGEDSWSKLEADLSGLPAQLTLPLPEDGAYDIRVRLTHSSHPDGSDPDERTLITYSNPVTVANPPSIAAYSPVNQATNVQPDTNLLLTFDKAVQASAGKQIEIRRAEDDVVVETIEATDAAKVSAVGTSVAITPSSLLDYATEYYVTIAPGAFRDQYDIAFLGLSGSIWSFKTMSRPSIPSYPSTGGATNGVEVLVNGKAENTGTASVKVVNGRKETTILVNEAEMLKRLDAEEQGATITIPVKVKTDILIGQLSGRLMKSLTGKQAAIVLQAEGASYHLPAGLVDLDEIAGQLGAQLEPDKLHLSLIIEKPAAEEASRIEEAVMEAGVRLAAPPVIFRVMASYDGNSIEIERYDRYVKRMIALPDGMDEEENRITTGVAVEPDGTVRHVPTMVVKQEGRDYALINSLTNSSYAVVWHPVVFPDAAGHWSEASVNDVGSRMIVEGDDRGLFHPDRHVTRAEFAAMVVRGLGLQLERANRTFSDVAENAWYNRAIETAAAYELITGFPDGTFRPNDRITREQAMTVLAKAMVWTGLKEQLAAQSQEETLRLFKDADQAAPWAINGVVDSVQAGIVSGRGKQLLAPRALITRAEVAAMIERLLVRSKLI
ncbi:S-layer homology domain-containing protein [Paenibacillus sp. J5C_2022]|uniref:S-layer homology domain-containing protein n=1 Tax=Paenibacillus sp. J5C2022 TaxID=2977129 RepID=UPI0021D0C404|nr:S-layer homology domain-containing protein [Paenibacillus sp. J5C2022]MCU6708798.1 S-layer homology domain-containing protein [Paenibacillus sp. J5C2022]